MSDLSGLGAAFRQASEKLGEAQSAAVVTRDRGDEALHLIGAASDGSSSILIEGAIADVAAADVALEEVLRTYARAIDNLHLYLGLKGL